jgi:hypothetical protein
MTTTRKPYNLDAEVLRYRKAKHIYETTRIGSTRGDAAYRTIDRIVEKAERTGNLQAFLDAAL